MSLRAIVASSSIALAALACGPQESSSDADGTWVGTITTEGNVTTVVNESGSVWGGTASLVEAASIGTESGDEPFLLGQVGAIGATEHRIYVIDQQRALVRMYDTGGTHLFDIGREGEGPGELSQPWTIGIDPAGRVIVQDRRRVSVFDREGSFIDTWDYPGDEGRALVVALNGTVFVPRTWGEVDERRQGFVAIAPDGSEGRRVTVPAYDRKPWELFAEQGRATIKGSVDYAPGPHLAMLPTGAIVSGTSDAYSLEIEHADGRRTVIKRTVELPLVPASQGAWLTDYYTAAMREVQPDWSWTANPIPRHKPAFDWLHGDRDGRIWVGRIMDTERDASCEPNARSSSGLVCWRDVRGFDVFEEESGRFLGRVDVPEEIRWWPRPYIRDDVVVATVEDEAGTITVKRYRLVLPGER